MKFGTKFAGAVFLVCQFAGPAHAGEVVFSCNKNGAQSGSLIATTSKGLRYTSPVIFCGKRYFVSDYEHEMIERFCRGGQGQVRRSADEHAFCFF